MPVDATGLTLPPHELAEHPATFPCYGRETDIGESSNGQDTGLWSQGSRFNPGLPSLSRYCSRDCGQRAERPYAARPKTRRVKRPSYGRLLREIAELGYCAVGRRYGVSDNAIRKWIRLYEREIEALRPVVPAEATS